MKNKFCYWMLLASVIAITSCKSGSLSRICNYYMYSGAADLTVTNVTTGENVRKAAMVEITIGGTTQLMVFHRKDVMELLFTPPEEFSDDSFVVTFEVFGLPNVVSVSPYKYQLVVPENMPDGEYDIKCSAICKKWTEGSTCQQTVSFKVE